MRNPTHEPVTTPGKFEGEPPWTEYFWEQALDGAGVTLTSPDNDREFHLISIDEVDADRWPRVLDKAAAVALFESDDGFVTSSLLTEAERDELVARCVAGSATAQGKLPEWVRLSIPGPDKEVVFYIHLERLFEANNFDPAEQALIQKTLTSGETYLGGGGASPFWTLEPAEEPTL